MAYLLGYPSSILRECHIRDAVAASTSKQIFPTLLSRRYRLAPRDHTWSLSTPFSFQWVAYSRSEASKRLERLTNETLPCAWGGLCRDYQGPSRFLRCTGDCFTTPSSTWKLSNGTATCVRASVPHGNLLPFRELNMGGLTSSSAGVILGHRQEARNSILV
ncbi:hypothetical protein BU26DRAFT_515398 [Trematosphaeria pertusa]|uniref:Uncharacterized protein n=1 Tax=Trematosphaeria pertusa TaxID=390896 RepID=A0A6A6ITW0_9PLEO|nr:uncharacterized protein BU26DRAFT_515398 [Trematosphaeria pertusa]KAF2253020.1 hypothetical protein BU26DRAFT_515398 [Trematosphaeria pertusa]